MTSTNIHVSSSGVKLFDDVIKKPVYREADKKTDKCRSRRSEKVVDPLFEAYWIVFRNTDVVIPHHAKI